MRRKAITMLITLTCLISSCTKTGSESPASEFVVIAPTATAAESPDSGSAPSADISAEMNSPSITEDYHPIVYNSFLLGGSVDGKWLQPSDFSDRLQGGEAYNLYAFDEFTGTATGNSVEPEINWIGPYVEQVTFDVDVPPDKLAISADWKVLPRQATPQSLQSSDYIEIVENALNDLCLDNPVVNIVQNYSVDLDGDGTDEVLLYAEYSPYERNDDGFAQFGDYGRLSREKGSYSILILRKLHNDIAEDIVLDCDVWTTGYDENDQSTNRVRYIFEICGFYDLNGDGRLEILTMWQYYEGIGYVVWEVSDDGVTSAIGNGWGA